MVVVWFFARRARCVRALARADIPDGAHLHLCDKVHECQRVRLPRTGTPHGRRAARANFSRSVLKIAQKDGMLL